jgi:predicted transcriptional regulator
MSEQPSENPILALTAQIVSAHVSKNSVAAESLPGLIEKVYQALSNAGAEPVQAEKPQPAVPVKRSVFPDYIICLEDGKKLKMLKRHLQSAYGMTPEQYRERWGLPHDYPMVAPNYAQQRSELAKQIGLGRRAEEESAEPAPRPAARRGRKSRAAA